MTMRRRVEVNLEELDQIIDRGTRAPLSESEGMKLKTALHTMAEKLVRKRNTEKTSAVLAPDAAPADNPESGESASAGHGRHGAAAFTGARRVSVTHATLHAGDRCPECLKGKVYRQKEAATLIRFVGHAPVEATVFEMERLRCNACQQVFTADEPETAGPEKYAVTVVAMIALLKYGTGVPFKRLERLQEQLDAVGGDLAVGLSGRRRTTDAARVGGTDPPGGARQRDAQRRHWHADTAPDTRTG